MKALILAAGLGTRLRPFTNTKPKEMMSIGGKPLLWHLLELLKARGITDIWINLHWHPQAIERYFSDGNKLGVSITYSHETRLLGTAGALKNPSSGIEPALRQNTFLVIYGDNLTNFNLTRLIHFHRQHQGTATIATYLSPEPWTMGVIATDSAGRILSMTEKPAKAKVTSNLVSAGILVCEPQVLDYIPRGFADFGFHTIPAMLEAKEPLWALNTGDYVQDIGTPERLAKARRDWKLGKLQKTKP